MWEQQILSAPYAISWREPKQNKNKPRRQQGPGGDEGI